MTVGEVNLVGGRKGRVLWRKIEVFKCFGTTIEVDCFRLTFILRGHNWMLLAHRP